MPCVFIQMLAPPTSVYLCGLLLPSLPVSIAPCVFLQLSQLWSIDCFINRLFHKLFLIINLPSDSEKPRSIALMRDYVTLLLVTSKQDCGEDFMGIQEEYSTY